jgi:hypothetical protein
MPPDHAVLVFSEPLRASLKKMGQPQPDQQFLKNALKKAGFEDIYTRKAKEPVGPWPKDQRLKRVGAVSLLNAETGFESYGMALLTRILGMDHKRHWASVSVQFK